MKKIIITIFVITGFGSWILAQSPQEAVNFMENEEGVGARALGMGNAFNAVADDYTAMYWNPAGLSQLNYHELSAALSNFRLENEASFHNTITLDKRSWTRFHSIGLAYKFPTTQGSFVMGLGYHRFKNYDDFLIFNGYNDLSNGLEFELENEQGESALYPFDQYVQQQETINQEGTLNAWTVAGGMQLSPNLSLGVSFDFYSGNNQYMFDFIQEDVSGLYTEYPGDFNRYELHQKILSDLNGWGVKLGSLLKLTGNLTAGFTIEFPTTLKVTETFSSNDLLEYDDGYTSELDLGSGEWEYLVKYPYKFSAGAALDLNMFLLAASLDYRDWSEVRFDVPQGYSLDENYTYLLDQNPLFTEQFRSVLSYAAGGELRVPGSPLKLRAGYRKVPSPLRDAGEDMDRITYSFGLGYDIDTLSSFDIGVAQSKYTRQSVDSYTPDGTMESISTLRIVAGIKLSL
jgi:long-subunit fatty acid transport protein